MAKIDTYEISSTIQTNYGSHSLGIKFLFEDGDTTDAVIQEAHTIVLAAIENFLLEANNSSSAYSNKK